ncbi:MAG: CzcE family metal-binding protein [Collimonas sp.]|uniref:CzcE family metal-binding protein n=1 Tax=Collimonas sp. TaxID=1963772 RepID=UPI00326363C8
MRRQLLLPCILSAMLCTACASSTDRSAKQVLIGSPAQVTAATRTIVIATDTNYVTVVGGEIIKFIVGENSFAWNFDKTADSRQLELTRAAPAGMLDHEVTAYVAPDPECACKNNARSDGHK